MEIFGRYTKYKKIQHGADKPAANKEYWYLLR